MELSEIKFNCLVPSGINGASHRASNQKDYFSDVLHTITLEKGEIVICRCDTPFEVRVPYHNVAWYTRAEVAK